jgi:hypothetical protein
MIQFINNIRTYNNNNQEEFKHNEKYMETKQISRKRKQERNQINEFDLFDV